MTCERSRPSPSKTVIAEVSAPGQPRRAARVQASARLNPNNSASFSGLCMTALPTRLFIVPWESLSRRRAVFFLVSIPTIVLPWRCYSERRRHHMRRYGILKLRGCTCNSFRNRRRGCKTALAAPFVCSAQCGNENKVRSRSYAADTQHRHHCPRGSRQDHAVGRDAPPERGLPRKPGGG